MVKIRCELSLPDCRRCCRSCNNANENAKEKIAPLLEELESNVGDVHKSFEWKLVKHSSYLFAGILFMLGSIFFYPSMHKLSKQSMAIGAKLFICGCLLLLLGSLQDAWDTRKMKNKRTNQSTVVSETRVFMSIINVIASIVFLVGAFYFLPKICSKHDHLGGDAFMFGCYFLCFPALYNIFLLREKIIQSICTIIGAVFFIIASATYLEEYIEGKEGNIAHAVHYFLVGSIFFTIAPIIAIIRWMKKLFSSKEEDDSFDLEASTVESNASTRRKTNTSKKNKSTDGNSLSVKPKAFRKSYEKSRPLDKTYPAKSESSEASTTSALFKKSLLDSDDTSSNSFLGLGSVTASTEGGSTYSTTETFLP